MSFGKSILPFFRSLLAKVKRPVEVGWPEEPLDLPTDRRGGFHDVSLGAILNSRYKIIRKLGWGRNSNVWLARDVKESELFAIKILTAHATKMQLRVYEELEVLQRITEQAMITSHPGRHHVMTLQGSFELDSPHGRHLCLIHRALGIFPALLERHKKLPVPIVKHVARQLLKALDFLHSQCRIIHTDIKPDNILISRNIIDINESIKNDELSASQATSKNNERSPENAILSKPLNVFTPAELADLNQVPKFDVLLTDYGTAAFVDGFHADQIQPYALRAPEVIIGSGWGTSTDIWNLGCIIFEFLTGRWLFKPRAGDAWTAEEYHLGIMPGLVGDDFDPHYYKDAKRFKDYFSGDEGHLYIRVHNMISLELALQRFGVMTDGADGINLVNFLRSMLRLKPSDRASAGELLGHKWLSS